MPTDDNNFLTSQIMSLGRQVASIDTKIDNFLARQADMKTEIADVKTDVATVRRDVDDLKQSRTITRTYFKVGLAAATALWSAIALFGIPIAKKCLGW